MDFNVDHMHVNCILGEKSATQVTDGLKDHYSRAKLKHKPAQKAKV